MTLSPQQHLDKLLENHVPASVAATQAGCTAGWVRRMIHKNQIRHLKAQDYLFVDCRDIDKLRLSLTSRSGGKRGSAKRPSSSR